MIATAYAKKTRKTMVRDVNKLINMGLMERTKDDGFVKSPTSALCCIS